MLQEPIASRWASGGQSKSRTWRSEETDISPSPHIVAHQCFMGKPLIKRKKPVGLSGIVETGLDNFLL